MLQKLASWGAKEIGSLTRKVRKLRTKLDRLRARFTGRGPADEEHAIGKQLREALQREEIWLWQRSRVLWLRKGDRNTGYFHAQVALQKRINRIEFLERADGSTCQTMEENHAEV